MSAAARPEPQRHHAVSDVGRTRDHNEDAHAELAVGEDAILLLVCDGMGGHEHGEVASGIAVEAIGQIVRNSPAPDPRERLRSAFGVANQRILGRAQELAAEGIGTTAVAAYVRGAEAWVAHVGDSRLYHVRGEAVLWRTTDHTRVQKMVQLGILTPDEAKDHPDANVVTRALGFATEADGAPLEAEVREEPLRLAPGDVLVLCSDGLYDCVTEPEIARLASDRPPAEAAQALVDLANARGGHDNITVTVLAHGAPAEPRRSARVTEAELDGPPTVPASRRRSAAMAAPPPAAADPAPPAASDPVAGARATPAASGGAGPGRRRAIVAILVLLGLLAAAAAVFHAKGRRSEPPFRSPPDAGPAAAPPGAGEPAGVSAGDAGGATPGLPGAAVPPPPSWAGSPPPATAGSRPAPRDGGLAPPLAALPDAGPAARPSPRDAGAPPLAPTQIGAGAGAASGGPTGARTPLDAAPAAPRRPPADAAPAAPRRPPADAAPAAPRRPPADAAGPVPPTPAPKPEP